VQVVRKGRGKCFWRKAPRATACQRCHTLKKTCTTVEVATEVTEAGPSKKKKVALSKGKGKEKSGMEMDEETGTRCLQRCKE